MREIFLCFFKLGCLAFGGPVAQVGLMHQECVDRRAWIAEDEFLRALNFCHILPGPEATQLAIYLGWRRRGYLAGVVAGLLFILPGYLTLLLLAWVYLRWGASPAVAAVLWGFRPVGLALLCAALLRIGRAALRGPEAVAISALAFIAFHVAHAPFLLVLLGSGAIYYLKDKVRTPAALLVFFTMGARADAAEPVLRRVAAVSWFFLKVGLFSFGGAYAVLPYLREGAVSVHGWLTDRQMIDALALCETTPGPLISIGTFVGYFAGDRVGAGILAATAATFWLFLPSFVFVLGAASHLERIGKRPAIEKLLAGVTCGVVGLMVSVSIVLAQTALAPAGRFDVATLVLGVAAFAALQVWKKARHTVVAVVLAGGVAGLLRLVLM